MVQGLAIFDGFLGESAAGELLDLVLVNEAGFEPSSIARYQSGAIDPDMRRSSTFRGDWSAHRDRFRSAIDAAMPALLEATGMKDWPQKRVQIDLAVHRDGDFFRRHRDTLVGEHRKDGVRLISAVYYFFRQPRGFQGGQLALFDPRGDHEIVEPLHDRLVVFPSFLPHEVRPIAISGDRFADARFSINCWLNRVQS